MKIMVLKNKKQGQAAIEFLMTYGWMLLVVLIVGALIFSFVDFGSLLPNQLDFSGDIRGSASESFALTDGNVTIIFSYNGANRVQIQNTSVIVDSVSGVICPMTQLRNANTEDNLTATPAGSTTFLNGHTGVAIFNCAAVNPLAGDVLQGEITFDITSVNTGVTRPSRGNLRLGITD